MIAELVSLILVHWIVIYPVKIAIRRLKNWNQLAMLASTNTGAFL